MQASQQLHFLQQKIQDLKSGIFFNLSQSVLRFPTALINASQVDEFGYVWFWVQKPKQHLSEFEAGFPVRLQFYRKGKSHFVQVTGNAWVVTDPEEMNMLPALEAATAKEGGMVLIKVKMQQAEYHETQTTHTTSWWQNAVQTFTAWFRSSNNYSSGNYFPAS